MHRGRAERILIQRIAWGAGLGDARTGMHAQGCTHGDARTGMHAQG